MDYSRAKSPNIGNVLNARRLARRKLQRSARRDQEKVGAERKVNINTWQIMCKEPSVRDESGSQRGGPWSPGALKISAVEPGARSFY